MTATPLGRQRFREYPLDGAMLYFQPARGVHVRVNTPATAAHRRRSPRVAMFGITNVCNLSCAFCSRDAARPSAWTVDTAGAALRGLDAAGTLEVAYGGGEPFAFRGFAELVADLAGVLRQQQRRVPAGGPVRRGRRRRSLPLGAPTGWQADAAYPPAWRALFAAEGVAVDGFAADAPASGTGGVAPRELVAIGRSVIATQYDAEDAFPELRALAWKRGAFVVPGGVHAHGPVWLLGAIRAAGPADRDRVLAAPCRDFVACQAHGDIVIAAVPVLVGARALGTIAEARDELVCLAGDRPLAAELCFYDELDRDEDTGAATRIADAITAALQRLGHREPEACRLWIRFWGEDGAATAAAFAAHVPGDRTVRAGAALLIEPAADRKRLAVQALRRSGDVHVLDGRVRIVAMIWHEDPPASAGAGRPRGARRPRIQPIDAVALEAGLRRRLGRSGTLAVEAPRFHGVRQALMPTIATPAPRDAVAALAAQADELGAHLDVQASADDPVGAAVRRLIDDVRG